ncbi:MAG: hypothetical protein A2W91_11430 [Bacteroidetes bacterium GWF2_38_335]|nr:MAG: hypothetical protein A2W91_11430 [Bacteroidetes bacterium GWF2_38_335]OFY81692.1 MAG: hypothetical protein A2281_05615 [Bacteroidetes bacterium RIFOXYA12_FULL_38_20]HBS87756.1 hypothetical protein [Bacteroidales bacterium]
MEESIIIFVVIGTIIFSIAVMLVTMKFVAKFGWKKLSDKFPYEGYFEGYKAGLVSVKIRTAQYNNAINLYFGKEGIYLKPLKIFSYSHPPVMIPIKDILAMDGGFERVLNSGIIYFPEIDALITLPPRIIARLKEKTGNL